MFLKMVMFAATLSLTLTLLAACGSTSGTSTSTSTPQDLQFSCQNGGPNVSEYCR